VIAQNTPHGYDGLWRQRDNCVIPEKAATGLMSSLTLRFLADESCDLAVVRALREDGYDVVAVSEVTHRSDDRELIEQADCEKRILLTEDDELIAYARECCLIRELTDDGRVLFGLPPR
jgi:uncharacterized protein with PIN domain